MRIVIILVLTLPATFVHADDHTRFDGNTLLRHCQPLIEALDGRATQPDNWRATWCAGYIRGVFESLIWAESNRITSQQCIPKGVSIEQVTRVVVKYLQDHPANLHEHGLLLVINALADAFPCSDAN